MSRFDSVSVRSTLYRNLYKQKGYGVAYRSLDVFPGRLFLECLCPPICRRLFDILLNCIQRVYQYLILHFEVKRYDGIVIMKYFSYETVALIRKNTKARLLYDFDDPIWTELFQPLLRNYPEILSCVDCVSVDNRYLCDIARKYHPRTFIFPPPAQFENLPEKDDQDTDIVTIGWIGSVGTSYLLYSLHSVLEEIGQHYPNAKLLVLGFPFPVLPFFEHIKWEVIPAYDQTAMNLARRKIDIGLFPLLPGENALGRGVCKAIMYMGASIPVAATKYGLVSELIQDGINGFLCENDLDWKDKLSALITDRTLRKKMGEAGFSSVEKYSLENNFQILEDNFLSQLS